MGKLFAVFLFYMRLLCLSYQIPNIMFPNLEQLFQSYMNAWFGMRWLRRIMCSKSIMHVPAEP